MSAKEPEVPYRPDSDSGRKLPNPDLNPLLNQTLGRNLGKWAQVYFTNPPEKREEAVVELLRELQGENASNAPTASDEQRPPAEPPPKGAPPVMPPTPESLACPQCHYSNLTDQLFCGMCGSRLKNPAPAPLVPESFPPTPAALLPNEGSSTKTSRDDPGDMEWLREKSLKSFEAEEEERRRPIRILLALVVAVLFFGFFHMEWRAHSGAPSFLGAAASVPNPSAPQSQPPANSAQTSSPDFSARNASPAASSASEKVTKSSARLAPKNSSSAVPLSSDSTVSRRDESTVRNRTIPDTPAGSGADDVAQAEDYLQRKKGQRTSTEAAKYLWRAVGKQNTTALVLLADLYERGDGVAKSCDQAKLLLIAAAKKGSAAAGEKLRNLQSSGCR
jgi:hypothetical protein